MVQINYNIFEYNHYAVRNSSNLHKDELSREVLYQVSLLYLLGVVK